MEYREKNVRDIWDAMKDIIMIVTGVSEGIETRNAARATFEEILAKNFPKLTEDIKVQNQ